MPRTLPIVSTMQVTQSIIEQLYDRKPELMLPYLSPDIAWITDRCDTPIYGYYQFLANLSTITPDLPCRVTHRHYHLSLASDSAAVITGDFQIHQKTGSTLTACSEYHLTFVWGVEVCKLKLLHAHIYPSIPSHSPDLLSFRGKHAQTYLISSGDILYVEAENMNCCVRCLSKDIHVCHPINQLETIMPPEFLRIHRGYIINRRYVISIRRYVVEMPNGITLPIPEKRYMEVLRKIEEHTGRLP